MKRRQVESFVGDVNAEDCRRQSKGKFNGKMAGVWKRDNDGVKNRLKGVIHPPHPNSDPLAPSCPPPCLTSTTQVDWVGRGGARGRTRVRWFP
ncbi:hypothetical protein LDENG_00184030 [Lucifuga dentata]|nr:hypothetical protein LDENG_00184030 [Lucifuga dentata]